MNINNGVLLWGKFDQRARLEGWGGYEKCIVAADQHPKENAGDEPMLSTPQRRRHSHQIDAVGGACVVDGVRISELGKHGHKAGLVQRKSAENAEFVSADVLSGLALQSNVRRQNTMFTLPGKSLNNAQMGFRN
ncbi:MAG: hypothetical protein N4A70_18075 [Pelagimonas sp.]|nr:hypothetical protein [Pelagimonas sp.]